MRAAAATPQRWRETTMPTETDRLEAAVAALEALAVEIRTDRAEALRRSESEGTAWALAWAGWLTAGILIAWFVALPIVKETAPAWF